MWVLTPDKSIETIDKRVIFFSLERFIADIVQGDCCFICGARPDAVPFNDEHILPDWILRRYKLHDRTITLPNGTHFRYGKFKIPCCATCNALLGENLEKPIRELFDKGYEAVAEHLKTKGPWRLFSWMSLIYLKTHLKDNQLRLYQDARKGEEKIGRLHIWEEFHHIHCVARAVYTHCELKQEALGSVLVLPAKVLPFWESFDYLDVSIANTTLLRIEDTAVIAVFDDCQASIAVNSEEILRRIRAPLSPIQLREVALRLAAVNLHLAKRPRFKSEADVLTEEYAITAVRPTEIEVTDWNHELFGKMMYQMCGPLVSDTPDKAQLLENLKSGGYTFLFKDNGEFAADHMEISSRLPQ